MVTSWVNQAPETQGNPVKQALSESIDDYLIHREARPRGNSPARLKSIRITLRRFLTVTGNILTENIHEGHIDAYYKVAAQTRSKRSLGLDTADLKGFFKWAIRTRRAGRNGDPMADYEAPSAPPRPWRGFHVSKLPALLDATTHPRDRILLALAAYLLGRSVEFTLLRISDVDLDAGFISYQIPKTDKVDLLPICEELDKELRAWLKVYAETAGSLDPNWHLVPAKTPPRMNGKWVIDWSSVKLVPTKPVSGTHEIAQKSLVEIGFPIRDEKGKSLGEGMHTIRRSMARAVHDQLRDEGDPNPVETVRAMLNHSTEKQTRDYIGLQTSRVHRNQRFRGKLMFPGLRGGNVSEIETYRREKEAQNS